MRAALRTSPCRLTGELGLFVSLVVAYDVGPELDEFSAHRPFYGHPPFKELFSF